MAATTTPAALRAAIKANHLVALKHNNRLAREIDRVAAAFKADLRRLVAEKKPDAGQVAAKQFAALAAEYSAEVTALIRRQAERAMRDVFAALDRQRGVRPPPVALQAPLVAKVAPPPDQHHRKADALVLAGLLGLLAAGVAAAVAGGPATGAEIAVDRLAGRAKRLARYGTVRVVNRATRVAVEAAVPVGKRAELPVAVPVPVGKRMPIPPIKTPPEEPGPVKLPVPVPPPVRRGPAPGEPEFVILPEPTPAPVDPSQPPPPRDPDPLAPFPTAPNLIGWQVLSMLLPTTRPKHRHRHKDEFFYFPRPERNERGMDECPNPPYESPRDGSGLAYGCVCRIVPLFNEG